MITFKQFLDEAIVKPWKSKGVDEAAALRYINKNCKGFYKAIKTGHVLYRGFELQPIEFRIMDTSSSIRTSRDSNNVYQLAMGTSSALSGIPKRENSLICSYNEDIAMQYAGKHGTSCVVVPVDGTKLACSKQSDFVNTPFHNPFDGEASDIYSFGQFLGKVFNACGVKRKSITKTEAKYVSVEDIDRNLASTRPELIFISIASIINGSTKNDLRMKDFFQPASTSASEEEILDVIKAAGNSPSPTYLAYLETPGEHAELKRIMDFIEKYGPGCPKGNKIYKMIKDHHDHFLKHLADTLFTPESLDIALLNYGDAPQVDNAEVWFSGKAVVFGIQFFETILNRLHGSGFPISSKLFYVEPERIEDEAK